MNLEAANQGALLDRKLRITALTVFVVRWPLKMKRRHGVGDIDRTMPGVIVRIVTDAGIVGWGEAAPWAVFTGTAEGNAQAIHVYFRPLLIGADPGSVTAIMEALDHAVVGHGEAKAAIEMALFDILGQRLGAPIHALLGGAVRDEVPLSVSIANPDFDEDMALARRLAGEGVGIFKVKTGFLDHAQDLHRMERLRAELPGHIDLRIDYNQGLAPWDALAKLRDMERFGPTFIEQPVPRDQRAAMGEIARALDTPIMADESVFSPHEAIELVRDRYADLVSVKIMKCGGILKAREIAAIAGAAGIAGYGGTMFEGGIAIAAGLHMVAATPNVSLGAEFYTS
ncbi:MAG TPA: enolase C-terminal domain-like protein, partial [Alphaproteobacteria bacterium]|nr:enolase C-terminal domain-like protein [Alphaproteobacteria bacterium]